MKRWLKAIRLRTLPLSLSGIVLGTILAANQGEIKGLLLGLCVSSTILFQILSNLANDLGDNTSGVDNDQRVGPKRSTQTGEISPKAMKRAVIILSVLSLISGGATAYVGTIGLNQTYLLLFIGLGVASIGAAIKYTMGKNPYGYSGLGDVFVFLFFGWLSVLGTYFLQTHSFDWWLLLPASAIGLLSAAVLNLNNMRDIVNDKANGKNTLVVKIGFDAAKFYHSVLILSSIIALAIFNLQTELNNSSFAFLIVAPILFLNIRKVMKCQNPVDLDPELKKIALSTFGIAVLYTLQLFI